MPRIYPFANALKLRHKIDYQIPEKEGENLSLVAISPWVELTNKYTALKLSHYSPEDMIRRFIKGEITVDRDLPVEKHIFGKLEIANVNAASRYLKGFFNKEDHTTNDLLMGFLLDDVVYDSADSWYLSYAWEPISREILFNYKDTAYWEHVTVPVTKDNEALIKDCTTQFLNFCFKNLKKESVYRILPKDYIDNVTPLANEVSDVEGYKRHVFTAKVGSTDTN